VWNVKAKVIPQGQLEPFQNLSDTTVTTYWENTKSRNYKCQPY